MCLAIVQMVICVKREGSMVNHAGRRGRYSTTENGYHFKNVGYIDLTCHAHILGTYMYFMFKIRSF